MTRQLEPDWKRRPAIVAIACLVPVLAMVIALHGNAAARAVQLWWDSPTYSFAFLIVPLSIYLIVMRHERSPTPAPRPMPWLTLLHLPIAALWYLAVAVEVIEVQQFCLLAAIYVTIAALVGWRVMLHHAVAMLLLVFLVPSFQFIVPPLQYLTAEIATFLLRLIDVPVYLDGLVIQLPEGSYFVAPGCAGLNFVLVAVVLALVVGELFYVGIVKRLGVLLGLIAMAMIANPIRVFAIVAIDHATNRTTDIVSDHLTYGWAFFAAVLAVCLPFALSFRDDLEPRAPGDAYAGAAAPPDLLRRLGMAAGLGVVLAALGPLTLLLAAGTGRGQVTVEQAVPGDAGDRETMRLTAMWRPVTGPGRRLLDNWPPPGYGEHQPERRTTLETAVGAVAVYSGVQGGDRRVLAVCFLVEGRCLADGGAYRRAVLRGLPQRTLAPAGLVILSRSANTLSDPWAAAGYVPLGAAMARAVGQFQAQIGR